MAARQERARPCFEVIGLLSPQPWEQARITTRLAIVGEPLLVEYKALKTGIMKMLRLMEWLLKTIEATIDIIDLIKVTRSFRQQFYCAGQKSWEVPREHIETQLDAVVVKRTQSEWAISIALVSEKIVPFNFLCTIGASMSPPYQIPTRGNILMILLTV